MWSIKRIFDLIIFLVLLVVLVYYLSQPIELVKESNNLYKIKEDNRVPIAVTTAAATFFLVGPDYLGLMSESNLEGYQFEQATFLPPVGPKWVPDQLQPLPPSTPKNRGQITDRPVDLRSLKDLDEQLAKLIEQYEAGIVTEAEVQRKVAIIAGRVDRSLRTRGRRRAVHI